MRSLTFGVRIPAALVAGALVLAITATSVSSDSSAEAEMRWQAEDMAVRTVGGLDGPGWSLWSNGLVEDRVEIERSGVHAVTVRALGRSATTLEPEMELRVNDRPLASVPVEIGTYGLYTFEVDIPAGSHRLALAFVNDPNVPDSDIDLVLDWVAIEPLSNTGPTTTTAEPTTTTALEPTTTTTEPTTTTTALEPTTTTTEPTTTTTTSGDNGPCANPTGIVQQFRGEDGVDSWTSALNFPRPEQAHNRVTINGPTELVPYGDASMRVEIKPGDPQAAADAGPSAKRRAEFSWQDWRYDGNAEGWVGAAFYLPSDPMATNRGTAIFQLHNWPEAGTLWNLYTWDGKLRTHNHPMGQIFETDIEPYLDTWVRVVVNFKTSAGNDGFLKMWLNDQLVIDRRGPTRPGGELGPYFKHGTYFWGYEKFDSNRRAVAYYDNLRVADGSSNYESVDPACWE